MPRKIKSSVEQVHETSIAVSTIELSPPHPPRTETPEYKKAHDFLINVKNMGCQVCGVTKKTLKNATKNPFKAKQIESHHYPVERSLADACDPRKVHLDFPMVYDQVTLMQFVDSPANLIVLCDVHHRGVETGIHHLVTQDFVILKYLREGYQVAATATDAATAEARDEQIEQQAGMEAQGDKAA